MSSPWLYALTVGPLGFYLWTVALWHSHRHPRVVNGLVDYALLVFGLGGVLTFGPFGQFVARTLFGRPAALDWMVVASALGLCACLLARRSLYRVVVYHVEPAVLWAALEEVLGHPEVGRRFHRTLSGFEDTEGGRGLRVDVNRWLRSAVVEAHGRDAEELIQAVRPLLRERLRRHTVGPSRVAAVFYGLSIVVMTAPLVSLFVTQPRAREAFRVLIERIQGVNR
jgi:hypothetical protein